MIPSETHEVPHPISTIVKCPANVTPRLAALLSTVRNRRATGWVARSGAASSEGGGSLTTKSSNLGLADAAWAEMNQMIARPTVLTAGRYRPLETRRKRTGSSILNWHCFRSRARAGATAAPADRPNGHATPALRFRGRGFRVRKRAVRARRGRAAWPGRSEDRHQPDPADAGSDGP